MPSTLTSPIASEPPPPGDLLLAVDLAAGRVVLTGELDRGTCGHLRGACRGLAAGAAPFWVLDLAALEFCDAAGLRALAAVRRAAEDAGALVLIVGARPFLRRVLPLVGLGDVLAPIARTMPGAVAGRAAWDPPPTDTDRALSAASRRGRCGAPVGRLWDVTRPA